MIEVKIFLLVLSIVFLLRYAIEFIVKLGEDEPTPMKMNDLSKILIYLSISYIITYMLIT